jgi:hypothetical protein
MLLFIKKMGGKPRPFRTALRFAKSCKPKTYNPWALRFGTGVFLYQGCAGRQRDF